MKLPIAAAVILVGGTFTSNHVSSFVISNSISSSHSFQKPIEVNKKLRDGKPMFGLPENNIQEPSEKTRNRRLERKTALDANISTYFTKYLPRTSTTQYFKRDSDLEEGNPEDSAVWTRALQAFMPNYFSSNKEILDGSSNANSTEIEGSTTSFLSNQIDVDALLKATGDLQFKKEASYDVASYLESVLAESQLNDDVLQNIDTTEKFNKVVNSTVSGILSYLEWGTSSLASSSPIKIEKFVEEASSQINYFFMSAATSLMIQSDETLNPYLSKNAIQDIIQNINVSSRSVSLAMDKVLEETDTIAKDNGLDVGIVVEEARGNAMELIEFGNTLLVDGYVSEKSEKDNEQKEKIQGASSSALFDDFQARTVPSEEMSAIGAGKMANLAAAIYEEDMVLRAHKLEQTIVANGSTSDVSWLVTDGIISNTEEMSWDKENAKTGHSLVRTITIKGFDATDENVDRERLLGNIWTATPEIFSEDERVGVHSGLLSVAEGLYEELSQYIDGLAPSHNIILNGHSIGGSLSNLLLLILTKEKGADWVKQRILKVYTYGAPPIACIVDSPSDSDKNENKDVSENTNLSTCNILESFDLPTSIVNGFCQPWDPCLRLFSTIDALYPLLDDIGADGNTLWASGPSRTLRPITRSIIESWENWPSLRDKFRQTADQSYISTGKQFLLLPETTRYLMDRLVSVNLAVPDTELIVELPPKQLFPALDHAFPLDTFGISMVPAALRSFIHHFHPAYATTLHKYSKTKTPSSKQDSAETKADSSTELSSLKVETYGKAFQ